MMTERVKLPVLPLRGVLVFPNMVLHLDVGRERSITALEKAMMNDNRILLMTQKDAKTDDPVTEDLYNVGTVAHIKQMIKLPGGTIRVLVEGLNRAKIQELFSEEQILEADLEADRGSFT
jgi:ATP-dependent Lon protease